VNIIGRHDELVKHFIGSFWSKISYLALHSKLRVQRLFSLHISVGKVEI
jgi:hypothetical protein